jgi:hypothetical protein
MKTLFVEHDPYSGFITEYLTDGKVLQERTTVDVAASRAVVDHTSKLQNDTDYSKRGIKNDWWHVATIPAEVQLEWLTQGYDIMKMSTKEIMTKLRHPDYAKLRATSGRF